MVVDAGGGGGSSVREGKGERGGGYGCGASRAKPPETG